MNVDKLKKMNVLADTLKQHGLAATREDAASLAGDMVGTDDETQFSKVLVEPDQKVSIKKDEAQENLEQSEPLKQTFDEEQIKNILQSFADQFSTEINRMSEKLSAQDEMIKELRQMAEAKKTAEPAVEVKDDVPLAQIPEVEEKPAAPPKQASQENVQRQAPQSPRSGGFSSEDVAIDKFFYYGQK